MKAYEAAELASINTRGIECINILYEILCDRIKGVATHGLFETTVDFSSEMNLRPLLKNYTWGRTSRVEEIKKGVIAKLQEAGYEIVESAGLVLINWKDAQAPEEESSGNETESVPEDEVEDSVVDSDVGDEDGTE